MRAERANLLACIEYSTAYGRPTSAVQLTAAMAELLRLDGPWQQAAALHHAAANIARRNNDRPSEANAL